MNSLFDIIARTVLAFALIMIITRLLGKHTITQMTYHDFVSSITLGALTSNIAFNTFFKTWKITVSLVTFSGIAFLIALISLKNRTLRKWLSGKPTILIENGKILEHNLKKLKFTLDTLNQELREKEIFDIGEVEYAVLELNGKLSVLRKPEYRQVTKKDLAVAVPSSSRFPVELIMDGQVIAENIKHAGLAHDWLSKELKKKGVTAEQVCYAVKGTNGELYMDLYEDRIKHPVDIE